MWGFADERSRPSSPMTSASNMNLKLDMTFDGSRSGDSGGSGGGRWAERQAQFARAAAAAAVAESASSIPGGVPPLPTPTTPPPPPPMPAYAAWNSEVESEMGVGGVKRSAGSASSYAAAAAASGGVGGGVRGGGGGNSSGNTSLLSSLDLHRPPALAPPVSAPLSPSSSSSYLPKPFLPLSQGGASSSWVGGAASVAGAGEEAAKKVPLDLYGLQSVMMTQGVVAPGGGGGGGGGQDMLDVGEDMDLEQIQAMEEMYQAALARMTAAKERLLRGGAGGGGAGGGAGRGS